MWLLWAAPSLEAREASFQVARFQLAQDAQVTAVPLQTNATLKVVLGVPQPSAAWTQVEPADADFGDGVPDIAEIYTLTRWRVEQGLPSNRQIKEIYSNDLTLTNDAGLYGGASRLQVHASHEVYLGSEHAVLRLESGTRHWVRQAGPFAPVNTNQTPHVLVHFSILGSTFTVASGPERELSLWRGAAPVRFGTDTADGILHVTCLTADRDGALWAGIDRAGLVRLRRQPFATLTI